MATTQQRLCMNQADGEAGYARNSAIQVSSQLIYSFPDLTLHCNPLYFLLMICCEILDSAN